MKSEIKRILEAVRSGEVSVDSAFLCQSIKKACQQGWIAVIWT